jgi:hypothetical protein
VADRAHEQSADVEIELRVRGELGDLGTMMFPGFDLEVEPATTAMRGRVAEADIAELCRRLRDAGIDLVSLRQVREPADGASSPAAGEASSSPPP